jgi:coenzyme Q-binding protein COQ10
VTTDTESRILPYTADLMYAVVSDVEKYPEFLPWVQATRIIWRQSDSVFDCEMAVGFSGFSERYTSRVTLDPAAHAIDVMQVRGPFSRLENHWRFTPQDGGCKVDFSIAFEFRNPLLNLVAGKAFERVLLQMSGAFEERAHALSTAPNTHSD